MFCYFKQKDFFSLSLLFSSVWLRLDIVSVKCGLDIVLCGINQSSKFNSCRYKIKVNFILQPSRIHFIEKN